MSSTVQHYLQPADAPLPSRKRRRLGKQLVKHGILPKPVVRAALQEQENTGARLGEILVAQGAIDAATLVQALAYQGLVDTVTAADRPTPLLPVSVALEHRAVALVSDTDAEGAAVSVAVTDLAVVPAIWDAVGPIEPKLTDPDTMERLIGEGYPDSGGLQAGATAVDAPAAAVETEAVEAAEPPVTEAPAGAATAEAEGAAEAVAASTASADESPQAAAAPSTPAPAESQQTAPPAAPVRRRGLRRVFGRRPQPAVPAPPARQPIAPAPTADAPVVPEPIAVGDPLSNGHEPNAMEPTAVHHIEPIDAQQASPEPDLPPATIIVGLRQATPATLARVAVLLESINYPRERLQVLAVHDPADRVTRRALHDNPLPAWVSEAAVSRTEDPGPRGLLLSGLRRADGELVTVVRPGDPIDPTMLRDAATGVDNSTLISGDELKSRQLTNSFLRQAEPPLLETLVHDRIDTAGPAWVFRTTELREAFGWETGA